MIRLATIAPTMLSSPPRMITAKPASAVPASSGDRFADDAISTPATVPTRLERIQVRRCAKWMLMPIVAAVTGSLAVARSAMPVFE